MTELLIVRVHGQQKILPDIVANMSILIDSQSATFGWPCKSILSRCAAYTCKWEWGSMRRHGGLTYKLRYIHRSRLLVETTAVCLLRLDGVKEEPSSRIKKGGQLLGTLTCFNTVNDLLGHTNILQGNTSREYGTSEPATTVITRLARWQLLGTLTCLNTVNDLPACRDSSWEYTRLG
jgi:hypothetical protein